MYISVQVSDQADHPVRSTSHQYFLSCWVLLVVKRDESAPLEIDFVLTWWLIVVAFAYIVQIKQTSDIYSDL